MYESLLKQLKVAVETGDPIAKNLKTFILNNYLGSKVLGEVNAIFGIEKKAKSGKGKPLVFTTEDFQAKKKAPALTPSISVVAEDDGDQYGNMWKKMLELSDDQFKIKFDKDIRVAINFLNNLCKEENVPLVGEDEYKDFSAKFMDRLRGVISLKLTK
jgi:hypothetical protein